jgi:hypothetical protein
MLTLFDTSLTRDCQGSSRRAWLRAGALGLGGITLSSMARVKAQAANATGLLTGRSVVLLFLQGGPPHIEFFDPKMTAPVEIRSATGEIQTSLPGITFGATFPRLAAMAHQFSIVRSYGSGNADHTYGRVVSGAAANSPAMCAIYARLRGNNHPQTGLPTNVLLLPEAMESGAKFESNFETAALPTLTQSGSLGPTYAAFNPAGGNDLARDMQLQLPAARLTDRKQLLRALDGARRRADAAAESADTIDYYQAQAFEVLARGAAQAFDLSREDPRTLKRYDTTRLFRREELTRYYDMRRASNLLGHQMLLARRLCEAGCGFVTVSDCGWDFHANSNSPRNMAGIYPMGAQVDHAVSTFIEDVQARGLSDRILLVVTGEMGRTPRRNNNGGRDHYGELTPLLVHGGGLRMGQVIGQSDNHATRATTPPFRPEHLVATVMHALFDVGRLRLEPGVPKEVARMVENGKPIESLARG